MADTLFDDDIIGNVSATMVVVDIYPEIIQEMIVNIWSPKHIIRIIQNETNQTFLKNLKTTEKQLILKMDITGYNDLNMSLLYKMIRHFNLLRPPNQGWGRQPRPDEISEGDDIERMNKQFHEILHRPPGGLTKSASNDFLLQSVEIARRMDNRIGHTNRFESKIQKILSRLVSQNKYTQALEKIAEYQGNVPNKFCLILCIFW